MKWRLSLPRGCCGSQMWQNRWQKTLETPRVGSTWSVLAESPPRHSLCFLFQSLVSACHALPFSQMQKEFPRSPTFPPSIKHSSRNGGLVQTGISTLWSVFWAPTMFEEANFYKLVLVRSVWFPGGRSWCTNYYSRMEMLLCQSRRTHPVFVCVWVCICAIFQNRDIHVQI